MAVIQAEDTETFCLAARQAWREASHNPERPESVVRVNHGYISDQPLDSYTKISPPRHREHEV